MLRSTWDYHLRVAEFDAWVARLERARVPLWNPAAVVRWNARKTYLRELAARGVPAPPARWLGRGERASLAGILAEEGWEEAVVKPVVSASAHETWRAAPGDAGPAQARLDAMLARGAVLVQRFEPEIESEGELSLVFLDGRFAHAVRKRPAPGDFRVQLEHGGSVEPGEVEAPLVARAAAVLDLVPAPLLYARVDLLAPPGGGIRLMELELIEPELFLGSRPDAAERLARAIARRAQRGP